MALDKLAIGGVNTRAGHFATAREQRQHIDKAFAAAAKTGTHQFGAAAMGVQVFDNLGERQGPMAGDSGALFDLVQAGAMGRIGGERRDGQETCEQGNKE
jgi:hypothetical protein